MPPPGAIRAALRAALARRDERTPARFASPLGTAILVDAAAGSLDELAPRLLEIVGTLEAAGVPRGRQFALFVRTDGERTTGEGLAWRAALGVPALFHDPQGATFGLQSGPEPIELDDELREAEAIVSVGPATASAGRLDGGPLLLCPGAAGARTVAAWRRLRDESGLARAVEFSLAAERLAPVDLAVTWDAVGVVTVAPGGERFAALTRAAGWA